METFQVRLDLVFRVETFGAQGARESRCFAALVFEVRFQAAFVCVLPAAVGALKVIT